MLLVLNRCQFRLSHDNGCRFFLNLLLLAIAVGSCASGTTLSGTINGTCGFYQGDRSNVVYSETFSGDGTFCTTFMAGGSFSQTSTVQVGDIFATGSHNTVARAPAGYGVFATFDTTFQVAQEYLISPVIPSSTPTGTVAAFQDSAGPTDDGSGLGSCTTTAGINLAGHSEVRVPFSFAVTFGQPVAAIETVHIKCDQFGSSWGDGGFRLASEEAILVYDANGNLLGPAIITSVPEPDLAAFGVLACSGIALISAAKRSSGRKASAES